MKKVAVIISSIIVALILVFVLAEAFIMPIRDVAKNEEEVVKYTCPIDGCEVDSLSGRVFAVAIDNGPKARPQNGLQEADLVYEVPVEGGITRFLALFYHAKPEKIGPVRSARPYVIDLARGNNAIYVHVGQSPEALSYFNSKNIEHINEMSQSKGFWRDKSRRAPVNCYTSYQGLMEIATDKVWTDQDTVPAFKIYSKQELAAMKLGTIKKIHIPYQYKKLDYLYDDTSGRYLRDFGGEPHMDMTTNSQLATDNIIVQIVNAKVIDDAGRLDVNVVGSGTGYLFQNGQMKDIIWSKESATSPVVYTDAETNTAIKLVAGKTFIELVPSYLKVTYGGVDG